MDVRKNEIQKISQVLAGQPFLQPFRVSGLLWVYSLPASSAAGAEALKVIFDTDIDGDNDDVAAAAILHALADAEQVEILAMGVVSLHPYSPACLDAINTYYGRGDIPIGVFGEGNLGHRHFIGSRLSETPAANPARIAFEAYFAGKTDKRHCADPATVLYAVCGTRYFGEIGPGACDVREDGFTRWNAGRDKQHFYNTQKLPIEELEQVMEQLLMKSPKHRK